MAKEILHRCIVPTISSSFNWRLAPSGHFELHRSDEGISLVQRLRGRGYREVLLTPEMLPLPPATPEDQRYVAGFGFAPDASDLIAGISMIHGGGPEALFALDNAYAFEDALRASILD